MIRHDATNVVLENDFLSLEYSIANQLFQTKSLLNKLTNEKIYFLDSKEFEIKFLNGVVINKDSLVLEKFGKTKNMIRFYFQEMHGIQVNYVVHLADNKYFKTHLELKLHPTLINKYVVDTIDNCNLKIKNNMIWHNPHYHEPIKEMANFDSFYANLGQPVYLDSFYFGNEYPLNYNVYEADNLISRKYYGKNLLAYPFKNDYFVTEKCVFGVADEDNYDVVQASFYQYLDTIKLPSQIRLQYNSWFDYMKDINEERILKSFSEIHNQNIKRSVPILHSYTIDDGWQKQDSLWEIDTLKFPNGFHEIQTYLTKQGSSLGLWISPIGGYTEASKMAEYLEENHLGSINGKVVNVADRRYIQGIEKQLLKYIKEYDLNYIKVDGMLLNPMSFTTENFLGGGYKDMYSMNETHELFIAMFQKLRAIQPNLWINYTSYVNPSPFYLQFVNSLWMQCSEDVGFRLTGKHSDQMLSYRDHRMYEMSVIRKFQIPNEHLYNHDPVYGLAIEPQINFDDEEFRSYLYFNFARGSYFNEFYYSYELMNDKKWDYHSEVVKWFLNNHEVLKTAKLIGNVDYVYGYYAQHQDKIILAIRNASAEIMQFKSDFALNDKMVDILSGNEMDVDQLLLGPYEILILEWEAHKKPLKIESVTYTDQNVCVYFNQVLKVENNVYFNNQKIIPIVGVNKKMLYFDVQQFEKTNEVIIVSENGSSSYKFNYYEKHCLLNQQKYTYDDIMLHYPCTITFDLALDTFNRTLIRLHKQLEIYINENGCLAILLHNKSYVFEQYQFVIPENTNLKITINSNQSCSLFVDDELIQTLSISNVNKFESAKLQFADIVSHCKIYDI